MVERYRRGKGKQPLLGNHQKCWIWGRNTVLETLQAARWPVVELYLSDELEPQRLETARRLADESNVPTVVETHEAISRRCRSREHQGYLAKMTPYPYADSGRFLDARSSAPLFVLLDAIQDPYNFGAIIRSAVALGVDAMFVGRRGQSEVSSLVARSSAGAVNQLPIAQADDLVVLAAHLNALGICVVAAARDGSQPACEFDFRQPTAIVIGNEGAGIRDDLLQVCERRVSIPQSGNFDSLNAAVAAGILFYEANRQRTSVSAPFKSAANS